MPTPNRVGTYGIADLMAATQQTVAEFGEDNILQVLNADLEAHNAIVADMLGLAAQTTDRLRLAGNSLTGEMVEVDEHGVAPTQKDMPGAQVGFPLRKYQFSIGWTDDWILEASPVDAVLGMRAAQKADLRNIQREVKKSIYLSSNYTFRDFLIDRVSVGVKRFWNADSAPIPDGPNGEVYDGATHTHYNFNATLTTAAADALIEDVVEHGHGSDVRVNIAKADEAGWRGLTGFTPYVDPRITRNTALDRMESPRLDITRLDNRPIGIYNAAEVWVKSWAIANYAFCYSAGDPRRPLVWRIPTQTGLAGLRIKARTVRIPLEAETMERRMGFGVWNRGNGAVLYHNNTSYTDPTIT